MEAKYIERLEQVAQFLNSEVRPGSMRPRPKGRKMPDSIEALIAELGAATEGSRELEEAIDRIVRPEEWTVRNSPLGWPDYTRSLDAAVTLVPEGMLWQVGTAEGEATVIWESKPSYYTESSTGESWASDGDTFNAALALCAAALKALQAMKKPTQ